MTDISTFLALEIADNWEQMAAAEQNASPGRRATLRECADVIRMLANREPPTCPHAQGPLRYCMECPVDPCPMELGRKST